MDKSSLLARLVLTEQAVKLMLNLLDLKVWQLNGLIYSIISRQCEDSVVVL